MIWSDTSSVWVTSPARPTGTVDLCRMQYEHHRIA
jgi:hypothetical protein